MHIIPYRISEYRIHYHENYLNCLCAGTVVTSLKDGFHIDIEIAGKIMSYSYTYMNYLYLHHYCFPAIVRTDMEITLKPLTCSNSND